VQVKNPPPEPKPWSLLQYLGVFGLLAFVILSFVLWWVFLFPHRYPELDCGNGVTVLLDHPGYIATGDEGELHLALRNETTAAITATLVVDFVGSLAVQVEDAKTTNVCLSEFPPEAESGISIPFHVCSSPLWFQPGEVKFQVKLVEESRIEVCETSAGEETHGIALCPIHGLVGYFAWFRLTPLALLSTVFWGWFKKRMLSVEK
jgi:hypothetical protein